MSHILKLRQAPCADDRSNQQQNGWRKKNICTYIIIRSCPYNKTR